MSKTPNAPGHPVRSESGESIKWSEMPTLTRTDIERAYLEDRAKSAVTRGWPYPRHCDWLLARVVDWANNAGVSQDIILTVNGTNISGRLISGEDYLEGIAVMTESGKGNDEDLNSTLSIMAESYRVEKKHYRVLEDAPDDYEASPPSFIHLADPVYIFGGGNSLKISGSLWRGRLSEIDGFILGTYDPNG